MNRAYIRTSSLELVVFIPMALHDFLNFDFETSLTAATTICTVKGRLTVIFVLF